MALDYFERAVNSGYASREWIENDSDFDQIRDNPRFKEILERLDQDLTENSDLTHMLQHCNLQ